MKKGQSKDKYKFCGKRGHGIPPTQKFADRVRQKLRRLQCNLRARVGRRVVMCVRCTVFVNPFYEYNLVPNKLTKC